MDIEILGPWKYKSGIDIETRDEVVREKGVGVEIEKEAKWKETLVNKLERREKSLEQKSYLPKESVLKIYWS